MIRSSFLYSCKTFFFSKPKKQLRNSLYHLKILTWLDVKNRDKRSSPPSWCISKISIYLPAEFYLKMQKQLSIRKYVSSNIDVDMGRRRLRLYFFTPIQNITFPLIMIILWKIYKIALRLTLRHYTFLVLAIFTSNILIALIHTATY